METTSNDGSNLEGQGKHGEKQNSQELYDIDANILSLNSIKIVNRNSQEIKPEEILSPIDGGWAWMVTVGSFFSNFVVDGILLSYGLKSEAILESFHESGQAVGVTEIGWIISLLNGFYGIGGPLAAALSNRFGFRIVATMGAIIASSGFGLTYLMCRKRPNLYALLILNGVVGGTGTSLMYVPSIIAVGFYFEKYRGLATGICVCGSGLGQTVFGTVVYYFVIYFGWKVTLLLEAGLLLSTCIFSAFYRPLSRIRGIESNADQTAKGKVDRVPEPDQFRTTLHSLQSMSLGSLVLPILRADERNSKDGMILSEGSTGTNSSATDGGRRIGKSTQIGHSFLTVNEISGVRQLRSVTDITSINSPLFRDDILYRGDMNRIPAYTETVGSGVLTSKEWCVIVTDDKIVKSDDKNEKTAPKCFQSFKKLFSIEILSNYSFILVAFSAVLTALAIIIPYAYLQGIATQNHQKKSDTTVFFTVMGAASTVSRISCKNYFPTESYPLPCGIIADFPKVRPAVLLAIALIIGGVATALLPLCSNYWLFIAFSIAFGFMSAFSALLLSLIVVDLMSLANLTNAFGYLCIFTGIASIIGAPLAGFLHEYTGSFNLSFFVAGVILMLSALALLPAGCVNRWEKAKKNKNRLITITSSQDN